MVALAVMTGLMLIAQPANEGSVPVEAHSGLPRAMTVAQASSEDAPSAAMRTARRSRSARPTPVSVRMAPTSERLQSP